MASPEEMAASMIANLAEKTGKSLQAWVTLSKKSKLGKHGELVKWLKSEHAITHGYANLIAHKTLKSDAASVSATADGSDLVEAQYAGKKAGLRPIYDRLMAAAHKLGKDVEPAPKKAYVSLRRNKQFAIVQPSTATRVDLGLNLPGVEPHGRLEKAGSWNSMCTHRVRLETAKDVDRDVKSWLKQAYTGA